MKDLVMILTDELVEKYKGRYPQLRLVKMGKHYDGYLIRDKENPNKVLAFCTVQIISRTMILKILDGNDTHYDYLCKIAKKNLNAKSIKDGDILLDL